MALLESWDGAQLAAGNLRLQRATHLLRLLLLTFPAATGAGGDCGAVVAGGEIDLDKEDEAAKGLKAAKPKRQRFERYDDDFIDDSELEMVKGADREVKTKFSGFYAIKVCCWCWCLLLGQRS